MVGEGRNTSEGWGAYSGEAVAEELSGRPLSASLWPGSPVALWPAPLDSRKCILGLFPEDAHDTMRRRTQRSHSGAGSLSWLWKC